MREQFQFRQQECTESVAHVELVSRFYFDGENPSPLLTFTGELNGPHSDYARTLPTTFPFASESRSAIVVDPCYWTPSLPFLYELRVGLQALNGETQQHSANVGLRRWGTQDSSFNLEGKRTVLRGSKISSLSDFYLHKAHEAEVTLVINKFDPGFCATADRLGVGLAIDLRQESLEVLFDVCGQLDWHASVLIVIVDPQQWSQLIHLPQLPTQCLITVATIEESAIPDCKALVVELEPEERLPNWLAGVNRPVIAIRNGIENLKISNARSACDKLQADLAPEFDLAGYFVAP